MAAISASVRHCPAGPRRCVGLAGCGARWFVTVKSEAEQAEALVFRTRNLLVQQRTQVINAIRGHLGEFGIVVAKEAQNTGLLAAQVEEPASGLPQSVRSSAGPHWRRRNTPNSFNECSRSRQSVIAGRSSAS